MAIHDSSKIVTHSLHELAYGTVTVIVRVTVRVTD